MRVVVRRSAWVACAALVGALFLAWLGVEGMALWNRLTTRQEEERVELARLRGWEEVAPQVSHLVDALFGEARAGSSGILQGLSETAGAVGVRIKELKPRGAEVEAGLEGNSVPLAAYLERLAVYRPPLRLEAVSFALQPDESAPLVMRVRVQPVLTASDGS